MGDPRHGPAPGSGRLSFAALSDRLAEWPGHRLFTVMAYGGGSSRRLWSSRPDIWPQGGAKPLPQDSELYRIVVARGVPRLVEGRAAIEAAFADHALILAAGCCSAINMPVRWQGRTLGALNLLHQAGHYSGLDFGRLAVLADTAAPLLAMRA